MHLHGVLEKSNIINLSWIVAKLQMCLFSSLHTTLIYPTPSTCITLKNLLKHELHFLSISITTIVSTTPTSLFSLLWSLTALLLKILDLVTLCGFRTSFNVHLICQNFKYQHKRTDKLTNNILYLRFFIVARATFSFDIKYSIFNS